jgi:hypothetical protein
LLGKIKAYLSLREEKITITPNSYWYQQTADIVPLNNILINLNLPVSNG